MPDHIPIYTSDLTDLRWLEAKAASASPATFKSRNGVRLQDGMILVPNLDLTSAVVEVEIAAPGPCYPGVAFRIADEANFELAYGTPHASGLWDALQYDPVFRGSNTWQIHHGPGFQKKTSIPVGEWYGLRLEFSEDKACLSVGGQPPLVVPRLARTTESGPVALWTYRPAYFRDLKVYEGSAVDASPAQDSIPAPPPNTVTEWTVRGHGVVACEPHGILLLNRYFDMSLKEITLLRAFTLDREIEVEMGFGFSDDLSLAVDGEIVFAGANTFRGFADRASRGYVEHGANRFSRALAAGRHELSAKVRTTEGFGWGLAFRLSGDGLELLPAES
jgi:hypothetical protein